MARCVIGSNAIVFSSEFFILLLHFPIRDLTCSISGMEGVGPQESLVRCLFLPLSDYEFCLRARIADFPET